jgi:hypothetical protein
MVGVWFQNIRWRSMGPEDRKRWTEIKGINRGSILGSHPSVAPGWLHHKFYWQMMFSEDLGLCVPDERIQAEHMDGVR